MNLFRFIFGFAKNLPQFEWGGWQRPDILRGMGPVQG
jgi:hypothetical protein